MLRLKDYIKNESKVLLKQLIRHLIDMKTNLIDIYFAYLIDVAISAGPDPLDQVVLLLRVST